MTQDHSPVTEDELHAYVDGELPADRLAAVTTWLAAHDEAAVQIVAWRAQAEAIRARYGAVAGEPVPARLNINRLLKQSRSWIAVATAASLAAFVVGSAAGWFAHGATAATVDPIELVAEEAIDAHKLYVVEVRHAVEVPGEDRTHIMQWLSKRVGYKLTVPDLTGLNLKLVGGRLLPGSAGAAAFYMYENAAGERFTMYCTPADSPETSLRYKDDDRVAAFYWVDKNVVYAVSGPADRAKLEAVTKSIYDQVEKANVQKL